MKTALVQTLESEIEILDNELFALKLAQLPLFAEWKACPSQQTYLPLSENQREIFELNIEINELRRQAENARRGRTVVLKDTYSWSQ